jgi:NitT/TauT family transport system substrate-binding protein
MKKITMVSVFLATVLLVTGLMSGCSSSTVTPSSLPASTTGSPGTSPTAAVLSQDDKNYVIQLGYYNCDHMTAACIAKDSGIFSDLGLNVSVTGNGQVPQAVAAGKMDVGYVGIEGVMKAQQKGTAIFVAANNHTGGSYYLVVSNSVKDTKELVGKRVSLEADCDKNNPDWCVMADKLGISRDPTQYKDYNMDIANKFLALQNGQLDGYLTCDPWGSMAEFKNVGYIAAASHPEITGDCCVYAMRQSFATEHPALARSMLLAHSRAIEYIYLHPQKAAEIFAANYNVPVEVALLTIHKKTVAEGRTLTWEIDRSQIKGHFQNAKDMGLQDYQEYTINDQWIDQWVNDSLLKQSGTDDFAIFIKTQVDPVFPQGMSYQDWLKKVQEIDAK